MEHLYNGVKLRIQREVSIVCDINFSFLLLYIELMYCHLLPDENKATYATNKIKKAATWNTSVENLNYLKQGIQEANQILTEIDLDENSPILAFLRLVSEGNATILNLTDDILAWIKKENLAEKLFINF